MSNNYKDKSIIFYDGHCPLCHYWIRYAIKKDISNKLYFAPIQGKFGKAFILKNNLVEFDTVIFYIPKNKPFIYSKAIYELLKHLEIYNFLYYLLMITPKVFSNIIYRLVARTRYLIYKRYDNCEIPSKKVLSRLIL